MAACPCHKETLVLDAHGALTPEERTACERHLAACEDCRQERERLLALIQSAKETLSVPALTSEEEQRLSGHVQRSLRMAKPDARPAQLRWWLAPAFAACMVLVVAGWFGLKNVGHTDAIITKRVPAEVVRNNKKLLENPGHTAAITSERVPEVQVVSINKELLENPGSDTAAVTSERDPEEIIRANKELLENMDLLQDMESLEQLVNILDKQEQETSLLERETDANHIRVLV